MRSRDVLRAVAGVSGVLLVSGLYVSLLQLANSTIVALSFLLVVLCVAATSKLWTAVVTSVAAVLCFNYFFLPPVHTFTIADPQNWAALFVFLAVSLVLSNLSSTVRAREREALGRRDELARLFDLSRDILLMTDTREAVATLARVIARRFDLNYAAICLPRGEHWDVFEAGTPARELDHRDLTSALTAAETALEYDARTSTFDGHRSMDGRDGAIRIVPLRVGTRPIGLLVSAGRPVEPGTLDALAGIAAIAIERVQFLEERRSADVARRSEELKSALLASLGHDLRTPLTAIRVAASNLRASWASDEDREVQSELILVEVERLNRLFQNILDMAKLDAGAVSVQRQWVHPSEVVDAARTQVEHTLRGRVVNVHVANESFVRLDPRLTAAALAHLLENAAQYAPPATAIDVEAAVSAAGLTLSVRDRGPGIAQQDLPQLFDRFYRGGAGKHRTSGTGMGLSIARGVLAVEQGQVWAENCPDGGARFTMQVPCEARVHVPAEGTLR